MFLNLIIAFLSTHFTKLVRKSFDFVEKRIMLSAFTFSMVNLTIKK